MARRSSAESWDTGTSFSTGSLPQRETTAQAGAACARRGLRPARGLGSRARPPGEPGRLLDDPGQLDAAGGRALPRRLDHLAVSVSMLIDPPALAEGFPVSDPHRSWSRISPSGFAVVEMSK